MERGSGLIVFDVRLRRFCLYGFNDDEEGSSTDFMCEIVFRCSNEFTGKVFMDAVEFGVICSFTGGVGKGKRLCFVEEFFLQRIRLQQKVGYTDLNNTMFSMFFVALSRNATRQEIREMQ